LLINLDSQAPNQAAREALPRLFPGLSGIRPETVFGRSRLDFSAEWEGKTLFVEVKGVTLEDGGTALFPDAPTERGLKHIRELTAAAAKGYHCSIDFVIQMNGIRIVLPNDSTMPAFRAGLAEAARAGVEINSLTCRVEADRIMITGCANDAARYQEP
jgi:sugar fermentation stimulation protein A